MEYKRKITAFLAAVLLCSGTAFAYLAPSGTGENTKALPGKSVSSSNSLPNLSVGSNDNLNTGGLFFKMMLMVLLVVALGAAAVYLSKKLLPKLNLHGKRIQVSETVHLGPRKAIHLIKIGKRTLLIGSTNENITKLAEITDLSEENLPVNQKEDN